MDFGTILTKEYISLFGFLILFVFVITNKKIERSDKYLYFGVILTGIVEVIVFEVESYLGTLSYPTFWRVFLSAIGYLLRPSLVVLIILLVDKNLRTKKMIALLLIPLAICFLCVSTAFFSHLCFWYNDTNNFQRAILGYVPHIVCVLYTFICLFVACTLIKKRDELFVLVLICASLCPVFAICLDMFVDDTGLSRISIMFCSLIMYIQNHSIALNDMIDDIPGAIAKFRVKNNSIKIVSFNDLMCQMFGLSYIEFKSITRDNPFGFLDEKTNEIFKTSIDVAIKQYEYSFRFKAMVLGKENTLILL